MDIIDPKVRLHPPCLLWLTAWSWQRIIKYRLHRAHCTFHNSQIFVKDLSRLGRDLSNTILLDNSADCYLFQVQQPSSCRLVAHCGWVQPENAIPINSWYDDQEVGAGCGAPA